MSTVADCLRQLAINLDDDAVVERDGPYIGVTIDGAAAWLVLVPERHMHNVERVLGTR